MNYTLEHATIRCRNLEESIQFYERMFQAQLLFRRNLPGGKTIVYLRLGDSMLELMDFGAAREAGDPREFYGIHHIGIKTSDLEAAYRDLKAKGAEFLVEPFSPVAGIRLAFLRDPNGAVLEIAERDPQVFDAASTRGSVEW
ncbi:MAG: VOC family protein [candidate division NC10 bacterium]|nr:VOC family protein [candidate division NC10 bacterium]